MTPRRRLREITAGLFWQSCSCTVKSQAGLPGLWPGRLRPARRAKAATAAHESPTSGVSSTELRRFTAERWRKTCGQGLGLRV
jgi:hypothetical protein